MKIRVNEPLQILGEIQWLWTVSVIFEKGELNPAIIHFKSSIVYLDDFIY